MNNIPNQPLIREPDFDDKLVSFSDVHMETDLFSDPDPDDFHLYSDFEIWNVAENQVVWEAKTITGLEKTHIHLGDGVFLNSHTGFIELLPEQEYLLRVRFSDNNNNLSPWAERSFMTSGKFDISPLNTEDILDEPEPIWSDSVSGEPVIFAEVNGASLSIKSIQDELLLEFEPKNDLENEVTNYPAIPDHEDLKVVVEAGNSQLTLPKSQITFTTDENEEKTIYLPPLSLDAGATRSFWVSTNGSTYNANSTDSEPNFADLSQGTLQPWRVVHPGYKVELVATGFQLPVNIVFNPIPTDNPEAPLFYVTELYGNIKVVTNNGNISEYATDILNFNPIGNFPGSGEVGLTGLAIDPVSGDLFVSMLYDDNGLQPQIIRFQSSEDGLRAINQTTILQLAGVIMGPSHQISNLTIGGDGKMYVHLGDGFRTDQAQNLEDFRGKILRINLDGTPAIDNPFYDESDGITAKDYVYASGFRNPFGGDWRFRNNFHYAVGNGPGGNDRLAKIEPGANYGWDGTGESMTTNALYNWNPTSAPVNLAFVQPEVFNGSGFPQDEWGNAFVTLSGSTYATGPSDRGKKIVGFALNDNGELVNPEPLTLVEYDGVGKGTAVGLAAGPDGLYFSDLYKDLDYSSAIDPGANIYRIYYEEDDRVDSTSPLTDKLYRLQNSNLVGTYLFTGEEELRSITVNYPEFVLEGEAFKVSFELQDELVRFNRFRNRDLPGAYLYAAEKESESIRKNFPNFIEEGIAFYAYGADAGLGVDIFRFRNSELPGSYIFVGEAEKNSIEANYPQFVLEGVAFEAELAFE